METLLIYKKDTGKIYKRCMSGTWIDKDLSPNFEVFRISILDENVAVMKDFSSTFGKVDINGIHKYYIDQDGDLAKNDDWEEYVDESLI